jgi:ATP-dependent protease ClpP protease subunit
MDIKIIGVIGSWWDEVDAKSIMQQISSCPPDETINVSIHSPGGDMFEGIAIYNALKLSASRVVVDVIGLAGSAASIICMAGDAIRMPENAYMMIHNPWGYVSGEKKDFEEAAALYDQFEATTARIYSRKTGKTVDEVRVMMDASTWMDGAAAFDAGFCTELTDAVQVAAFARLPKSMIETIPEAFRPKPEPQNSDAIPAEPSAQEPTAEPDEPTVIDEPADPPTSDPDPVPDQPIVDEDPAAEAAEIVELCLLAGRPAAAAGWIKEKVKPATVRAQLAAMQLHSQQPAGVQTNAEGPTEALLKAAESNLTIRSYLAVGNVAGAMALLGKGK